MCCNLGRLGNPVDYRVILILYWETVERWRDSMDIHVLWLMWGVLCSAVYTISLSDKSFLLKLPAVVSQHTNLFNQKLYFFVIPFVINCRSCSRISMINESNTAWRCDDCILLWYSITFYCSSRMNIWV